ncbi:hypothetical protein STXM2123_419 [Streptomyces sp. F-3]|nr:hypothetical protein STXM2123_419 [Streptomyces sp. F-3]
MSLSDDCSRGAGTDGAGPAGAGRPAVAWAGSPRGRRQAHRPDARPGDRRRPGRPGCGTDATTARADAGGTGPRSPCGRPDEDKGGGFLLTATSSSLENHSNALTTTRVDPRLRPAVP